MPRWLLKTSKGGETPSPVWATCARAQSLSQWENISSLSEGTSCVSLCAHLNSFRSDVKGRKFCRLLEVLWRLLASSKDSSGEGCHHPNVSHRVDIRWPSRLSLGGCPHWSWLLISRSTIRGIGKSWVSTMRGKLRGPRTLTCGKDYFFHSSARRNKNFLWVAWSVPCSSWILQIESVSSVALEDPVL